MKKQLAFMKYEGYKYAYPRSDRLGKLRLMVGRPRFFDYYKKGLPIHPQQMMKLRWLSNHISNDRQNEYKVGETADEKAVRHGIRELGERMIKKLEYGEKVTRTYSEGAIHSLAKKAVDGRSECKFHEGGSEYDEYAMNEFAFEIFGAMHAWANAKPYTAKSYISDRGKGWLAFELCFKERISPVFTPGLLLTYMAESIGANMKVEYDFGSTFIRLEVPAEGKGNRPKPSPPSMFSPPPIAFCSNGA